LWAGPPVPLTKKRKQRGTETGREGEQEMREKASGYRSPNENKENALAERGPRLLEKSGLVLLYPDPRAPVGG
jgi:hypothetical protein